MSEFADGKDENPEHIDAAEHSNERIISINKSEITNEKEDYPRNAIQTSKYTVWNFFPLNLFEQLRRPANAYFVVVAILQSIPPVSISQGKPTILLPLIFVLTISAIKDAFEDRKRHRSDKEENERKFDVYQQGEIAKVESQDIQVGDLIKIKDDESFPADLLLIMCAHPDTARYCYVETSNLDGETNLKIKQTPEMSSWMRVDDDIKSLTVELQLEPPTAQLDSFSGHAKYSNDKGEREDLLTLDHLLLRGSSLKNSDYVYGLVVYTGVDSKILRNNAAQSRRKIKRSGVEKQMNKQILVMFCVQICICFFGGVASGVWLSDHKTVWYLRFGNLAPGLMGFTQFFTWFIIFAGFVPISLLVSMELVKFWQAQFMQWDMQMMAIVGGEEKWCNVQTSGLNEELGQVEYVFSDKTGTLTCNRLDFRKCVMGTKSYGTGETEISRAAKRRQMQMSNSPKLVIEEERQNVVELPHINFDEGEKIRARMHIYESMKENMDEDGEQKDDVAQHAYDVREYLTALAIDNTCFPVVSEDGVLGMKASSPDDEALVCFSNWCGVEFYELDPPIIRLRIKPPTLGKPYFEQYQQLALLDFTSKRKRMTTIVRDKNDCIRIYSKGADSSVCPLLRTGPNGQLRNWKFTEERLLFFAHQGLRTLVVAGIRKPASWWDDPEDGWSKRYKLRMKECAIEGPAERGHWKGSCSDECRRCLLEEEIEKDAEMDLLGATAIEDKLQDQVPETISALLDGGIKVWVLTGDKLETAINIGNACSLLDPEMEKTGRLLRLTADKQEQVVSAIQEYTNFVNDIKRRRGTMTNAQKTSHEHETGLVVTSKAFAIVMAGGEKLIQDFIDLATQCKACICCRLQPDQKATIVSIIKKSEKVTCLGIGDGANDEPMIRVADVGVGIVGVEGTAAVRASDYAFGQFRFLRRLLFVHGALSYRRISLLICYIFYKNALLSLAVLWFGFFAGFSGQPFALEWAYQLYNVAFTAFPILVFAIFDRDLEMDVLEKNTYLYSERLGGTLFNRRVFWLWIGNSVLQSFVIAFFPMASYVLLTSPDETGQSHGIWTYGMVVYTCVVIATNVRLGVVLHSWTWLHYLSLAFSIAIFYISMLVLSASTVFANAGSDYFSLAFLVFADIRYWLSVIVTSIAALLVDWAAVSGQTLFWPNAYDIQRKDAKNEIKAADCEFEVEKEAGPMPDAEMQELSKKSRKKQRESVSERFSESKTAPDVRRLSSSAPTGFDFSHTAGVAKLRGYSTYGSDFDS